MSKFRTLTDIIIDNIEGGYYHPNMNIPAMGKSGETMYGMDRLWGGDDITSSDYGKAFWSIIDKADAKNNWAHGYKAQGTTAETLRNYACAMMTKRFTNYGTTFLKDNYKIVYNDNLLSLHFFYACWNGKGWFKKFASDLNAEITRQGGKNLDYSLLYACCLNSRINSTNKLISAGGKKMQKIWSKYYNTNIELTPAVLKTLAGGKSYIWIYVAAGVLLAGGVAFYGWKKGWF